MGGLSLWHWLIVLVVVVLIFGTKRLRNLGSDLGETVKGFKKGMSDDDKADDRPPAQLPDATRSDAPAASDARRAAGQRPGDHDDEPGAR